MTSPKDPEYAATVRLLRGEARLGPPFDRLAAAVTYVHALLKSAQIAECIRVGEATLPLLRRSQGHMSKSTVEMMGNVASVK